MSAALVESVREAIAAGHTRIGLWQEDDKDRVWLYLPAILAALTEGEALRAQVVESQAREVALREWLLDALADMPSVDCEKCTDIHVVRTYGEPDDYDCGGEGCIECGYADKLDRLEKLSAAPTDTAALRKVVREAALWTAALASDLRDDFDGKEFYELLKDPKCSEMDGIVDRVLGGS